MSLLIKALQKAEQSKNAAASGEDVTSIQQVHQEPFAPPLVLQADIADEDVHPLAAESGFDVDDIPVFSTAQAQKAEAEKESQRTVAPQVAAPQNSPQAAANVFKAKTDVSASQSNKRALWLALSGTVVLVLAGGGFYFYLDSLQQPGVMVTPRPLVQPSPVTVQAPQEEQPSGNPATSATDAASVPPTETSSAAPVMPQSDSPPPVVAEAPKPEIFKPETKPENKPVAAEPVLALPHEGAGTGNVVASAREEPVPKAKPAKKDTGVVRSSRNRSTVKVTKSDAMAAYQAYMAGDDATAERLYREALKSDQRNIEVLLGLAAVAGRQGRVEESQQHYLHVLELEPKNAAAQAGLISLLGQADPVKSESRLKGLLAQQTDAAFLHEALANLYAEQGHWPSAQQSYFQAFHLEPANAEYAFNLAVSLDQLGKADLALNYYQRAQELLTTGGGTLDKPQLDKRIRQLRQLLNK